jgi:hypothetical protein
MGCLVRATHTLRGSDSWVWSSGGMMTSRRNWRTVGKWCIIVTSSNINTVGLLMKSSERRQLFYGSRSLIMLVWSCYKQLKQMASSSMLCRDCWTYRVMPSYIKVIKSMVSQNTSICHTAGLWSYHINTSCKCKEVNNDSSSKLPWK